MNVKSLFFTLFCLSTFSLNIGAMLGSPFSGLPSSVQTSDHKVRDFDRFKKDAKAVAEVGTSLYKAKELAETEQFEQSLHNFEWKQEYLFENYLLIKPIVASQFTCHPQFHDLKCRIGYLIDKLANDKETERNTELLILFKASHSALRAAEARNLGKYIQDDAREKLQTEVKK